MDKKKKIERERRTKQLVGWLKKKKILRGTKQLIGWIRKKD